jgi:signal transduction histidine kinase
MKHSSLKSRILWLLLTAQALLLCVGILGSLWYTRRQIAAAAQSNVVSHLSELLSEVHENDARPGTLEFEPAAPPNRSGEDLYAVRDQDGRLLAGSADWIPASARDHEFFSLRWQHRGNYVGSGWIHARVPDQDGGGPQLFADVFYASPTAADDWMFLRVAGVLLLLGLGVLAISGVASNWAVTRGLEPVRGLAAEAQKVNEKQWTLQVTSESRATEELVPLVSALESLLQRLQAAFERERRFLGDAAHELKTSLAIQQSTLQLADRDGLGPSEYRHAIEVALTDTARTHSLVLRMLQLARAEHQTSAPPAEPTATRMSMTMAAAISELEAFRHARSQQIKFDYNVTAWVFGGDEQLATVWRNLLDNAMQHSPKGSTIEVETLVQPTTVCVRIKDCGEGIPPEHLPHIFDRFYRCDSSRSRATGGFGLGLSIVKALVLAAGGTCELQSEAGTGTTAVVTLRRAVPQEQEPAPSASQSQVTVG